VIQSEAGIRVALMSQMWKAREQVATHMQKGDGHSSELLLNTAEKFEGELKQYDERFADQLKALQRNLHDLNGRL